MSEILETTLVRMEFSALYDYQRVTEELERCLNQLFVEKAFAQAMQMSALLSLNKDRIVVALWENNFDDVIIVIYSFI